MVGKAVRKSRLTSTQIIAGVTAPSEECQLKNGFKRFYRSLTGAALLYVQSKGVYANKAVHFAFPYDLPAILSIQRSTTGHDRAGSAGDRSVLSLRVRAAIADGTDPKQQ
jgi:hypothetical protein